MNRILRIQVFMLQKKHQQAFNEKLKDQCNKFVSMLRKEV